MQKQITYLRKPQVNPNLMLNMLRYMRPHKSDTEEYFIEKYLDPFGMNRDKYGNRYLEIGKSKTLWSCHTDTIHHIGGKQKIDVTKGFAHLSAKEKRQKRIFKWKDSKTGEERRSTYYETVGGCLGADDTSGVWIMTEMIKHRVPGFYIFHRGEERGCVGSRGFARDNEAFLGTFDRAIAFDRMGFNSVISSNPNCSNAFASALASLIHKSFSPDPTGILTDTCSYDHIIPECTNISVGYEGQHTSKETQHIKFLVALRHIFCSIDVESLPVKRDPTTDTRGYGFQGYYSNYGLYEDYGSITVRQAIKDYPDSIKWVLSQYGIRKEEIQDAIYEVDGDVVIID